MLLTDMLGVLWGGRRFAHVGAMLRLKEPLRGKKHTARIAANCPLV
jgi:hypothetical protein